MGDEEEKISDAPELAQVRRQARRVHSKGFLVAVFMTLVALALPA